MFPCLAGDTICFGQVVANAKTFIHVTGIFTMRKIGISLLLGGLLVSPLAIPPAFADASADAIRQLQADMAVMMQRLDTLAAENAELRREARQTVAVAEEARTKAVSAAETAGADNWSDRISLQGDLRGRYENTEEQGKEDRNRIRIRARAAIVADLPNNVEVGIGVASGSTDPVSTNQTLGDGGSTKSLNLDLAYFDWSGVEGLHVIGGKFKNFLVAPQKHGLLWDGDWRPEGIGVTYETGPFFANAIGTWLESDSKNGNSEFSYGAQAGINAEVGPVQIMTGAGYFDFNTKGNTAFYGDTTDPSDFFGNSVVGAGCGTSGDCVYAFDYTLVQVFGDVGFEIAGLPLNVYFDYVNNTDAGSSGDTGYAVGAKLGKVKAANSWQLLAAYQDLEKDAVLGLLTDSDFAGGGTDNKGVVLKGAWGISDGWSVGLSYFMNDRNESTTQTDFDRFQVDTQFKFK